MGLGYSDFTRVNDVSAFHCVQQRMALLIAFIYYITVYLATRIAVVCSVGSFVDALESDTDIRVLREVIMVNSHSCHIYLTQKMGPEALGAVCIFVLSL